MRKGPTAEFLRGDGPFAAIDFETADHGADSACEVAVVKVENRRVSDVLSRRIRPPRPDIFFSWLHGITWHDLRDKPVFAEAWPEIAAFLEGMPFLVAHNCRFDRNVLYECCQSASFTRPVQPFACTVQIARHVLGIRPANLFNVCASLGIELEHHRAESDALACAKIALAGRERFREKMILSSSGAAESKNE